MDNSYVVEFHNKFNLPIFLEPTIDTELGNLRLVLLKEEMKEVEQAVANKDIVNLLQELCDLQYILDGTFLSFGLLQHKEEGMKILHEANLSKLDEHGKPIFREDGKVLKSKNFKPADFAKVLGK